MSTLSPQLGNFGAFTFGPVSSQAATELETLGYGTLWIGGTSEPSFAFAEPLLAATESLVLAISIVNIWSAPVEEVAAAFHRIETTYPGRFLLGVGAGHREHTTEYRRPYAALTAYLDDLDAAGVQAQSRILAALGPRMLRLAARRSLGTSPVLTPVRYDLNARTELGQGPVLAPIQPVLLGADAQTARIAGKQFIDFYLGLGNYVSNWRRLGYSDDDVTRPGSDRLVDDLLAYGTADVVAARLHEHLQCGADHVAVQAYGAADQVMPTLRELGPLLKRS